MMLDKDRDDVVKPLGKRLIPTPTPLLIPVPEELLEDDNDANTTTKSSLQSTAPQEQSSSLSLETKGAIKRKLIHHSDDGAIFKKPLPSKHLTYPPALDTKRQLKSSSSSSQLEVPTAHSHQNQSCQ